MHVPTCTICFASCHGCNFTLSMSTYCNQVMTFSLAVVPTTRCSMCCLSSLSYFPNIASVLTWKHLQAFCLAAVGRKGPNGELAVLGLASADDRSGKALYLSLSFDSLDISCVDHLPEELIAVTIQGLSFSMAMGFNLRAPSSACSSACRTCRLMTSCQSPGVLDAWHECSCCFVGSLCFSPGSTGVFASDASGQMPTHRFDL